MDGFSKNGASRKNGTDIRYRAPHHRHSRRLCDDFVHVIYNPPPSADCVSSAPQSRRLRRRWPLLQRPNAGFRDTAYSRVAARMWMTIADARHDGRTSCNISASRKSGSAIRHRAPHHRHSRRLCDGFGGAKCSRPPGDNWVSVAPQSRRLGRRWHVMQRPRADFRDTALYNMPIGYVMFYVW